MKFIHSKRVWRPLIGANAFARVEPAHRVRAASQPDATLLLWRRRRLRISVFALGAALTLFAHDLQAAPGVSDEMQQFLNVPVWYLNYSISVQMNGPGETAGYTITGRLKMGLRSQGVSLSQMSGEVPPPTIDPKLLAQIQAGGQPLDLAKLAALATAQLNTNVDAYATWMFGANYDDSKTDAENQAEQLRVRIDDKLQAVERLWWRYDGPSSSEGGRDHNEAHGSGPMLHTGQPTIEIDGIRKRYKLLFEPNFSDTLQSTEAVAVVMESGIGTKQYNRQVFKTSMSVPPKPRIESFDPELPRIFEGSLPENLGSVSGSSVFKVTGQQLSGTCTFNYMISPEPPEAEELVIEPPPDFDKWMAVGGSDEQTAGDVLPFKVVLQKKGGGTPKFKASRFIYSLIKTSHEKGVCMNWPAKPDPTLPYDLGFEPQRNPDLVIDEPYMDAIDSTGDMVTGSVNVSCFDYGAYGELQVCAELENGQVVYGIVRGTQDQQSVKLPARRDGSNIANAFFTANGLGNLQDDDDSENDPVGDGFKGDGLTLYEEYRGFMNGDNWMYGDPKKKDVFVLNQMRSEPQVTQGIRIFEKASGLAVHRLLKDNQVDSGMVINFNRTSGPHVVDQHVIRIKTGKTLKSGETAAFVEEVGTPGTAKSVNMPPDWKAFSNRLGKWQAYFAPTIAHEMMHDCNVSHHGEADQEVLWVLSSNPSPHISEVSAGTWTPITLKREDGSTVTAAQYFPKDYNDGQGYKIWLGVPHGQHSGDDGCLMRYTCSWGYVSTSERNVRYLSGGEPIGFGLCVAPAGAGVNAAWHMPQSRYDAAATDLNGGPDVQAARGDCKDQLRVNDLGEEPHR